MSVKVMSWVFDESVSTGNDRLVLLAIADHADDERWSCWPSVARLASKAKVSERTAQRAIRSLVELGELAIVEGGGSRKTHRFTVYPQGRQIGTVPVDQRVTPEDSEVTQEARRGAKGDTRTIRNHQRTAEQQDDSARRHRAAQAKHQTFGPGEPDPDIAERGLAHITAIRASRHAVRPT